MVTECNQKQITNRELFSFFKDSLHKMMGLQVEEDDHFLVLKDKDKVIARWNATEVTLEEIRDTANSYIIDNCNGLELQLLRFWKLHPRTKLSLYTIVSAPDASRTKLRHAIRTLVTRGILKEQHDGNGLSTYSLSNHWQIQEKVEGLVKLEWGKIEIVQKQLQGEAVLV